MSDLTWLSHAFSLPNAPFFSHDSTLPPFQYLNLLPTSAGTEYIQIEEHALHKPQTRDGVRDRKRERIHFTDVFVPKSC